MWFFERFGCLFVFSKIQPAFFFFFFGRFNPFRFELLFVLCFLLESSSMLISFCTVISTQNSLEKNTSVVLVVETKT